MDEGLLERTDFALHNAVIVRRHSEASVSARDFCAFCVPTLAGPSLVEWPPVLWRVLERVIAPACRLHPGLWSKRLAPGAAGWSPRPPPTRL